MTVAVDQFKKAMQYWASGVAVVTTQSQTSGVQGMTVTAFSSVSAEPPQVLVCINDAAETGSGIQESQSFAVNVLNADQQAISNQFAGGASMQERFANNPWTPGVTGSPLLTETLMSLDCKVVNKLKAGTHWVIIGEVQDVVCRAGEPVLYYSGGYRALLPSTPK